MWRMSVNKKSLHLHITLKSPRSFHSGSFSLLKRRRDGRFYLWKEWWRHRTSQSELRVELKPEPNAFHSPHQLPPVLPNLQALTLFRLWLPLFKMTPRLPFMPHPLPLPHPMDELWFSVTATGPPVGGNGHAKGPGSLPPCPLDIFCHFLACLLYPVFTAPSV